MSKLSARSESVAILSFVVLFAVFGAQLTSVWIANLPTMFRDIAWLGIVATGQAMVIISGEFDLSVGSVFAFVGLVFVMLLQLGLGPTPAFVLSMSLAAVIGLLNGILTWNLGLPSLLVTLGFLFVYRGFVQFFTGGFPVAIPENLRGDFLIQLLGSNVMGFHNSIPICVLIVAAFTFVLTRTRLGSHLHAVGGNLNSAIACGVLPGRTKIIAFVISAALAGFTGIIAACTLSSVSATTADGLEFEAIAAAVIGGCSLRGGVGSAWGAVIGVGTLMALKAGLILLGINIFIYQILLGAVLVSLIALKAFFPKIFSARFRATIASARTLSTRVSDKE
jgi:simple sugar transport system permease protein